MTREGALAPDPVAIVIPVYRDLAATRRCLESVLAHSSAGQARIILIDDASPEPELAAWCDEQAATDRVELLRNDSNLGFVASVNRGMRHAAELDVVLLNSDTEVPPGWLQRLQHCATGSGQIATVTPFSNNATICSYPLFCQSSGLPEGLSLEQLDALFARANPGLSCELPTAVGFCVYIPRAALNALGLFDEAAFGRGYGEENDFSRRAVAAGWSNLLCADLFVYHQGGASFGDDSRELMAAGNTQLLARFPDYADTIAGFVAEDPLRDFRHRVDELRLALPGQAAVMGAEWRLERERLQALAVQRHELELLCRNLGVEIEQLRQSIGRLEQRCRDYEQRCENYDARCVEYQQYLDETRQQAALTDAALTQLQGDYRDSLQAREQLTADLTLANETLQQIYNSRVWRYSSWLRKWFGSKG
ncbi:glycosyltransferase [Haliea sp. E1-2-M8]|uniref:glycosyltransferase family 2 protein n=1 Tax=Haliea sp. E1-2-M8 TaxID=3064706 RepID=UPI00272930E1|nr:glycosyltransferase [Haliea sp. E1-2-M8]MDO8862516.1 glycosyltransferase [Haliea sp. E1-2-M8]